MSVISGTRILLLALLLGGPPSATAQVAVPPLTARVTDQTATLTAEQKAGLEQTLKTFEERKGSQLAVLMVPSSAPETIEQFGLRVAEQWKLGRKNVDDGALLIIAKNDRALRIEVGYGLEGALNDATAKRIISEVIVPRFKEGDFYGGIAAGVDRMVRVIDGEPLPEPARRPARGQPAGIGEYFPVLFIAAIVVGGMLRSMLGRFPGALATGGAVGFLAWLFASGVFVALIAGAVAFVFTLLGGGMSRHTGWGGVGHRGGWGGMSGGGGFSGGGGGFGGGGASGRW